MDELRKKYEEMLQAEARAAKEDTLKELSTYQKEQGRRVSGAAEEPRAMAGPYSFTAAELINQVEQETVIGRSVISAMVNLKANLAGGGE